MNNITEKPKDVEVGQDDSAWHLDKRVPVVLLITLLAQIVTGVYYIARLEARINMVELSVVDQRSRDDRQDRAIEQAAIVLRQDMNYVRSQLDTLLRDNANRGAALRAQ